jgi:folate-binding Fe-S cluster repair protein YgfZ
MPETRLFERAVIRVAATEPDEDPADFLQGLLTNDVTGDLPVYAGLLTPQGKALFDLIVWPGGREALLIDCEAAVAEELVRRLSMYRLRRKLAIARDDTVFLRDAKSLATSCGWKPMPANSMGSASPRAATSGRKIPRG